MNKEDIMNAINFVARMAALAVMCMSLFQNEWNQAMAFGVLHIGLLLEQWDTEK